MLSPGRGLTEFLLLLHCVENICVMASPLRGLESLSFSDRVLFKAFGQGRRSISPYSLVHKAFESISDSTPSLIAVEYDGKSITYGDLEVAANVLANRLMNLGLQPKQSVCLLIQRCIPSKCTLSILLQHLISVELRWTKWR